MSPYSTILKNMLVQIFSAVSCFPVLLLKADWALWLKAPSNGSRKTPQSKWSCMDCLNVQNLLVKIDDGPMDRIFYANLDSPNE